VAVSSPSKRPGHGGCSTACTGTASASHALDRPLSREESRMRSHITIRQGGRRALIAAVVLGGLWSMLAPVPVRAQSEETLQSQFILNFARFTTWPSAAFASPSSPLVVGFVSTPELAEAFDKIVTGKNINGRELKVKKFDSASAIDDSCQMIVAAPGAQ